MNSTQLQCGHPFLWEYSQPDDLVYCRRCDGYSYPDGWVKKHKRSDRGSPPAPPPLRVSGRERLRKADVPMAKKRCAELLAEGLHINTIAEKIGVSPTTIRKWRDDGVA